MGKMQETENVRFAVKNVYLWEWACSGASSGSLRFLVTKNNKKCKIAKKNAFAVVFYGELIYIEPRIRRH